MFKLRQRFDHITGNMLIIAGGQVGRMALGLVAGVLIARSLGAETFGIYGVLSATMGITGVLADMGLTTTIAQRVGKVWPDQPNLAQKRSRVFFWSRVVLAIVVVGVGLTAVSPLAQLILGQNDPYSLNLTRLALVGAGIIALSGSATALLRASQQFKWIALVVLVNAGLTAALSVLFWASGRLTLVVALLVLGMGTSLVSFGLATWLLPTPLDLRLPLSWTDWAGEWKKLWQFGRWVAVSTILAVLLRQVDVILLNQWHGTAVVGAYFLAVNLVTKLEVINHSQYTVLVPTAANLTDRADIRAYLGRSFRRNLLLGGLMLPALWLVAPFVNLFYGVEFAPAIPLFRALFALIAFDLFTLPITVLFYPLAQPKRLAVADLVGAMAFTAVGLWLIPLWGPWGAITAKAAGKVIGFLLVVVGLRKL